MDMPLIRIELQQMRHTIITALNNYHFQVSEYVSQSIEKAIQDFDYENVVKKEVEQAITDSIRSYFSYGEGKDAIRGAVVAALKNVDVEP